MQTSMSIISQPQKNTIFAQAAWENILRVPLQVSAECKFPNDFQQRPCSAPFISGDGFRAISDHIFDETTNNINLSWVSTVAPGDSIFVKTEMLSQFFPLVHNRIEAPYILITHNSDYSSPYDTRFQVEGKKGIL